MLSRILYSLKYRLNKITHKTISGNGNKLDNHGVLIGCEVIIKGENNHVVIEKGTIIRDCLIRVVGNNCRIVIGENCSIRKGELWVEDDNCLLKIGKKTTVEHAHFAVTENHSVMEVGEDCMFAKEIEVRTGDSHPIFDENNIRLNPPKNVVIGNHVWVGNKAIILKGVDLGDGVIIAGGSVVTKSFEQKTLAGGNPAKVLKENVTWARDRSNT